MTVRSRWAGELEAPDGAVAAALRKAGVDAASLDDNEWATLVCARGAHLDALCGLADEARRDAVGDVLTVVANRNLDTGFVLDRTDDLLETLVHEAWQLGATEICMQGPAPVGIADGYLEAVRRIKAAAPGMHLHAFRAPEMVDGARRLGVDVPTFLRRVVEAGLDSMPGTAALVLDDDVRAALGGTATGFAPAHWVEVITAAHRAGLRSTATIVYGHLESAEHQVAHIRSLLDIQASTGGFTELIPMPMVAQNAPPHRAALAGTGPSVRESRAIHAVARLMCRGAIDHVQVAWTKLDPAAVRAILRGGADDFGGLLMDGRIEPEAGAESGRQYSLDDVRALADDLGREFRQRTTSYGDLPGVGSGA
ncbi:FO synthase [Rhodococcus sp. HNM0569]|uniref:FO synthase n=1 Tax=Rhodococcus sp. HNM0569 TaxID=2716340 RepID=UPI00146F1DB7|nr:FO synthase [Rhodococcus sp. HNM0569]NLU81436.1 FO synthase [Rhodococcus sp. HNM0569]